MKNYCRTDTESELQLLKKLSLESGAFDAVVADHYTKGGLGAKDLATAVINACQQPTNFKFLYPLNLTLEEKIRTIAQEMYGATDIVLSEVAQKRLALYANQGFNVLPICMAKTQVLIFCLRIDSFTFEILIIVFHDGDLNYFFGECLQTFPCLFHVIPVLLVT